MNFSFFIAQRVAAAGRQSFARLIIRIAIGAVALSMAVMIVATCLINGFKNEISSKMFGFWGHIHIMNNSVNTTTESTPIPLHQEYYKRVQELKSVPFTEKGKIKSTHSGVKFIQSYATKAGIIKTKGKTGELAKPNSSTNDQLTTTNFEGIVLKGIGSDYNWDFLNAHLIEGRKINYNTDSIEASRDIIISKTTASRMLLKTGDKFIIHFVQGNDQLQRVFQVCGVYSTGIEEYDKKFALVDIAQVQDLLGWQTNQVAGFEVFINDLRDLKPINDFIYKEIIPNDLYAVTVREEQPAIFQWLDLQDVNEYIILGLMLVVSIINMVTALLILILERTNMIGTMKSLGGTNWSIQKIFIYYGAIILSTGLLFGNILGFGLAWLQRTFHFIKLSEADYYLREAPISFNFPQLLGLNLLTLLVTTLFLLLPSILVTSISPVKAIKFK
jgi:lipoprotein-releasing system permease protein